jgi:RNA polymerase sigma-70 factor (ECF subfamily)
VNLGNFPGAAGSKLEERDFEPLFRQNGAKIHALAVRLCGNATDGEDLAQETFLTAYRRIGQFRGEAEFGSWVYRICVNLWKNRVRYEKRRSFWKHVSIFGGDKGEDDPAPLQIPDPKDVTEAPAEADERRRLVREAMAKLDPHERAALVLREVEDKSYEEIADLLDLPLGTVKSRIARARQSMKEQLEPLLGETP